METYFKEREAFYKNHETLGINAFFLNIHRKACAVNASSILLIVNIQQQQNYLTYSYTLS